MAYSLIANLAAKSPDGFDFTSASINTTGADFLVVAVSYYDGSSFPLLTDSKSNTWVGLTSQDNTPGVCIGRLLYSVNPTVGSGHTFSLGNGNVNASYGSLCVAAFGGSALTTPFDVQNGGIGTGVTSVQPGSITPGFNNELVIAGYTYNTPAETGIGINLGFTITDTATAVAGIAVGTSLAYLIQTTAAAVNPTWSWTTAGNVTAEIASFKAAAAAAGFGRLLSTFRNRLVQEA